MKTLALTLAFLLTIACSAFADGSNEVAWMKLSSELGFTGDDIVNAFFAPGDTSIYVSSTYKVMEISLATGDTIRTIPNIRGIIKFSDDSQYIYTYDFKKVKWPSGEVVGEFTPKIYSFTSFDINEKAGVLVGVVYQNSQDQYPAKWKHSVWIYDLKTFQLIDTVGIYLNYYSSVQITDNGKFFRTGSEYVPDYTHPENRYNELTLWNINTLDTIPFQGNFISDGGIFKTSPDSSYIGLVGLPYVKVFKANTLEEKYKWDPDSGICINSALAFTSDSKYLVTKGPACLLGVNDIPYLRVWDLVNNTLAYKYSTEDGCMNICISKNNNILDFSDAGMALYNWMIQSDVKENQPKDLIIYPNPATNKISIKNENANNLLRLEIYDEEGRLLGVLYNNYIDSDTLEIDLSKYSTGTYFLKKAQGNSTVTYKIIKEK
jgi:hypothetical protein